MSIVDPLLRNDETVHSHRRPLTLSDGARTLEPKQEYWLKRPVDILFALLLLGGSLPIALLVALAIKVGSRGPLFYTQERWGRGGTTFRVYKFRTMIPESDRLFGLQQAQEHDKRITPIGRVLRAMGLDELPQVLNILWGDMSFVGPRALAVGEILSDGQGQPLHYEQLPGFYERMTVRPGLTGLATIYIPKDATPRRKFRYDSLYIRRQSLGLDVSLVALSVWISLRGKWETRHKKV